MGVRFCFSSGSADGWSVDVPNSAREIFLSNPMDSSDWDPDPAAGVWTSADGWANVDVAPSGGNTGSYLSITFTNTGVTPDGTWQDIIRTDATSLYAGAYVGTNFFKFDFWASNQVPGHVQVWWGDADTNRVWAGIRSCSVVLDAFALPVLEYLSV